MKLMIILSLLFSEILYSQDQIEYICQDTTSKKQPFYISDEYRQGDKIWENLRNIDNENLADQYIPRGSIVYTPPEFIEKMDQSSRRIPVKVLTVPSKENEDRVRESRARRYNSIRSMINTTRDKKRTEPFSVGWIDKNSVRKASDYTFKVIKDSPIFKTPGNVSINDNFLAFSHSDEGYDIKRCCTPDSYQGEEICFDKYKFIVKDSNDNELDSFFISENSMECNLNQNLAPVANRIVEPVKSIVDLLRGQYAGQSIEKLEMLPTLNRWNGSTSTIARSEMIKFKVDDETGEGPYNSFHYRKDDDVSSDAYLKPYSHCAFLQVLKKHNQECSGTGCQVQFGDMYHHDNWGSHSSHDSGECIDIRPLRKNEDNNAGLTYTSSRYDRDKNKKFIQLLKDSGAKTIIFNDRKITGLRRDSSGAHNDHIHVCFGENVSKVKDTCKNGLD